MICSQVKLIAFPFNSGTMLKCHTFSRPSSAAAIDLQDPQKLIVNTHEVFLPKHLRGPVDIYRGRSESVAGSVGPEMRREIFSSLNTALIGHFALAVIWTSVWIMAPVFINERLAPATFFCIFFPLFFLLIWRILNRFVRLKWLSILRYCTTCSFCLSAVLIGAFIITSLGYEFNSTSRGIAASTRRSLGNEFANGNCTTRDGDPFVSCRSKSLELKLLNFATFNSSTIIGLNSKAHSDLCRSRTNETMGFEWTWCITALGASLSHAKSLIVVNSFLVAVFVLDFLSLIRVLSASLSSLTRQHNARGAPSHY